MTTQAHTASFTFFCAEAPLEVLSLTGEETLSQLFEFQLRLIQKTPYGAVDALDPQQLLGKKASLTLRGDSGERTLHGILTRFFLVSVSQEQLEYETTLMPSCMRMSLNRRNRIFQQQSTPSILRQVLQEAGFQDQVHWLLRRSYAERDYCVQYQESDWDFICRLMEEEGIFFYFRHDTHDILVLGDAPDAYGESGSVNFRADAAQHALYDESLQRFEHWAEVKPSAATLRDYRFKNPDVLMETQATGTSWGGGEHYHTPGEFVSLEVGQPLVKVRLEEAQRDARGFEARGTTRKLACGDRFQLQLHPIHDYNRAWLVVTLHHRGTQSQTLAEANLGLVTQTQHYQVTARGIPGDVVFRPARRTPRPLIPGLQSAVITGPEGEVLHTDRWGRIKLKFQWDTSSEQHENSSCWVRVDQSWAGQGYGKLFHPRVGQEVWVHFLEGDPDRPVVVGRVHNDAQGTPYQLPDKRTLSTLKTQTVGGQGYNEWRFEDQAGKEEIFVHGQKDWRILIEHHKDERIGLNKNLKIGRHHNIQIGKNKTETIIQNETSQLQKDRLQTVGMNEQRSIGILRDQKIGSDDLLTIGARHDMTIGHDYYLRVNDAQEESVREHYRLEAQQCIHYAALNDHLGIDAKTSLRFSCGGATLELQADGTILIEGSLSVGLKGESQLNLKGGLLKLN
ncbi:MAG: type VI secretion system Vgr family protein [Myxococcota bacterium]